MLVTLDTTALEQKVISREQVVKTAELAVRTAGLSVTTAEINLQIAKDAEETVKAAEIDLEKAIDSYRKITYPYDYITFAFNVPAAIVAVHEAELRLEEIRAGLELGPGSDEYGEIWHRLTLAQENLAQARERLSRGVGVEQFVEYGDTPPLAVEDFWTLRAAQLSMEKAKITLEKAKSSFQSGLDKANITLENVNIALEKAKLSLGEARDDLDTAKDELEKAVVVAPFAGFITRVNVDGGDEVRKGTVAVQLADPDKFEAEVMVGEMDILQLKLGDYASVQVDAMPEINLPAKVTHIAPTATIQAGVVNYKVKIEVESRQPVQRQQPEARPENIIERLDRAVKAGRISPEQAEQMKARLKQLDAAVEAGNITQEQADQIKERMAQGPGPGQEPGARMVPQDFQLREGLTVTVTIVVDERNDVLLVPNRAITRRGQETFVQVMNNGATEERSIKTGISNWQFTEVTDGLGEGEEVVISQGTATTSQEPASRGGMPFIPGMRRPR